jgi:hypothetical protein
MILLQSSLRMRAFGEHHAVIDTVSACVSVIKLDEQVNSEMVLSIVLARHLVS